MEGYLRKTQEAVKKGLNGQVHIVLGNEACDIDSAAAAITYAYYLDTVNQDESKVIVPILNITSADFRLRTEVTYYFAKVNITLDALTFRDQVDLSDLHKAKRLTLTLVDHNVLPGSDKDLDDAVKEVIDHHQRDRPPNEKETVVVELVGSCCTLVAEKLTTDDRFQMDPQIAELLYGVVLLDTVNLLEEAGRTTPKDIVIVDLLEGYRAKDVPGRKVVFSGIEQAKADVSGLTVEELLRKDMKVLSFPNIRVVFSALPIRLEAFLSKDDAKSALQSFSEKQESSVIIIMTLTITESGAPERQIAVFSNDPQARAQCVELLQSCSKPDLELSPMETESDQITAFTQGNVKASRKKVLPYIKTVASKITLSSELSDDTISPSQDSGLALDSPSDPSDSLETAAPKSTGEVIDLLSSVPESTAANKDTGLIDLGEDIEPDRSKTTHQVSKIESMEEGEEEDLFDPQPASTRPGGLLDLDFFEAPAEDKTSETGSLGSLDDYAEEQDVELVPAHSHGKMLELISDALEETGGTQRDRKEDNPKPAEPHKRMDSESDLFEHHEGVLMGPSPLQGTTPDMNLTPDTSQPTSPPNTSYPSTPPNSFIDLSVLDTAKGHQILPSFMNADMVRRIHEKKAELPVIDEDNMREEGSSYPFTPHNSVVNISATHNNWERDLPTFGNVDMIQAVHNKRKEFTGFEPQTTADALKFPYTPPNSFADTSFMQQGRTTRPFDLVEEDVAARLSSKRPKSFDESKEDEELAKMEANDNQEGSEKELHPDEENVVALRIAQEMRAQDPSAKPKFFFDLTGESISDSVQKLSKEDIRNMVNPVDGNVVAYRISQDMLPPNQTTEANFDTDVSEEVCPEALTPAMPKSDTMELLSNTDSLQAELARAEGDGAETSPGLESKPTTLDRSTSSGQRSNDKALPLVIDDSSKPPASVKFTLPDSTDQDLKERLEQSDPLGRPASESQVSASTDDSELSQGTQDFLSRMRSDTGASAISGNLDDLLETAHHIDAARKIVDEAISAAVDIVKEESPAKEELGRAGEWESAKMNKIHEAAMLDTTSSTSKEVDEMNSNTLTAQRPLTLEPTTKKKIVPNLELLRDDHEDSILANASVSSSEGEALDSFNDLPTPDDLTTPEAFGDSVFDGELDWEESENSDETPAVEPIPEYTAKEEFEDEKNWRTVSVGDRQFRIDMKVIEPYKKVLSHGGYYGDGFNAIIVFAGCYLPDKRRRDYHYVMDNLFLYVLSTLELLVVEDYMIVYFHGATPKQKMPSLRWLKRCYDMIDRRLRKNLKNLLIVHPTLWIRTIMALTKPFISSKFTSKLKYIRSLKDLAEAVPMEYIFVPDEIKMFDAAKFRQHPPSPTAT